MCRVYTKLSALKNKKGKKLEICKHFSHQQTFKSKTIERKWNKLRSINNFLDVKPKRQGNACKTGQWS